MSIDLVKTLHDGKQTDSILIDFLKAFEKVSPRKLCLKLQHYGTRGKLLKWTENFVSNQTQKVVMSGKESQFVSLTYDVLQGSALGHPLLLSSNMLNSVSSSISLVANDFYVYI